VPLLRDADAVVHCAASLGGAHEAQVRDTIDATSLLVQGMREAGTSRIVLVSSFAVYDYRVLPAGARLDETTPVEGHPGRRGPYVEAKLAQERIVGDTAAALDWRIVRPGLVFGPSRTWFYHLGLHLGSRLWVALAGGARLPLTYVGNCAEALVLAAEAPEGRRVVNVVDDDLPTRAAYMAALASRLTPRPVVVDVPWAVLQAGGSAAHAVGLTPGMLEPSRLAARCKPLTYSNERAKAAYGWRPATPFAEAMKTL
jgi:nucleoside-diphosphate-sugar epimerase